MYIGKTGQFRVSPFHVLATKYVIRQSDGSNCDVPETVYQDKIGR